jgi:hypothetical protein
MEDGYSQKRNIKLTAKNYTAGGPRIVSKASGINPENSRAKINSSVALSWISASHISQKEKR